MRRVAAVLTLMRIFFTIVRARLVRGAWRLFHTLTNHRWRVGGIECAPFLGTLLRDGKQRRVPGLRRRTIWYRPFVDRGDRYVVVYQGGTDDCFFPPYPQSLPKCGLVFGDISDGGLGAHIAYATVDETGEECTDLAKALAGPHHNFYRDDKARQAGVMCMTPDVCLMTPVSVYYMDGSVENLNGSGTARVPPSGGPHPSEALWNAGGASRGLD